MIKLNKKSLVFIFATIGLLPLQGHATDAALVLKRPILTMDAANTIAQETIKSCRKRGVNVAVTVVDRGGQVMVVMRDTLAMPLTLEVSRQKAYSALSFNSVTSSLEGRFSGPASIAKIDGVMDSAGGVPINAGGNILGGVGVSGAPSGKTDEACAQDGVKAVLTDLEMSM